MAQPSTNTAEREFVITREFDAPRELVFKVWTEQEHLERWWGPVGFTLRTAKLDLRPGGEYLYCMQAPNGAEMWGKFVYREIVEPERIVFVSSFSDEHGRVTRAPMIANWPLEILNILTFTEHNGKTTITLRGGPIDASVDELNTFGDTRPQMQQGFDGTFAQLTDYLSTMR